jgi:hypothetical protein
MKPSMHVKLWGVQGSIPAPLTPEEVNTKMRLFADKIFDKQLSDYLFANGPEKFEDRIEEFIDDLPQSIRGTYAGDTSCIEVQCRDYPLAGFDMGTGGRRLGMDIMKNRMFLPQNRNINPLNTIEQYKNDIAVILSHCHSDHIQGFPFFEPAFIKEVDLTFYGRHHQGVELENVLKGQQEFRKFP